MDIRKHHDMRLAALESERSSYDSHWRELSEYVEPRSSRFLWTDTQRGQKKHNRIINCTASLARRTLVSGMMSGHTSPARPWFILKSHDPDLNKRQRVKEYHESLQRFIAELFIGSNLYSVLPLAYGDIGLQATSAFCFLNDAEDFFRAYHYPIGSFYLGGSARNTVNACYRRFSMSVGAVVEKFGKTAVSRTVRNLYDRGNYDAMVPVVHAACPNPEFDPKRAVYADGKRFWSHYYEVGADRETMLRRGSTNRFRVIAARWELCGEEVYGNNSPGMLTLGDVKGLQHMERRKAQAIDKTVTPPMNAPASMKNSRASVLSGDVNYIDATQGQQSFTPSYQINFPVNDVRQEIRELEQRINSGWFVDLFLMLAGADMRSGVTAREIAERHEEKLLALGPVVERLNDDQNDDLLELAVQDILEAGIGPEPPEELQGTAINIEYSSVMAQAMKLVGIGPIERSIGFYGNLAGVEPKVLQKINFDKTVEEYHEMVGAPAKMLRDQDEVDAMRAAQAQQAAAAQAAQAALAGVQGAKLLSETDMGGDNALSRMMQQYQGA